MLPHSRSAACVDILCEHPPGLRTRLALLNLAVILAYTGKRSTTPTNSSNANSAPFTLLISMVLLGGEGYVAWGTAWGTRLRKSGEREAHKRLIHDERFSRPLTEALFESSDSL
jgi:hypothetical protein